MALPVATGVIDLFLHPPMGVMRLELIPGEPHTGLLSFNRQRGPIGTDAYGFRWLVLSSPPGYGVTPGPGFNEFDRTVIRVGVFHTLLDGSILTSQGVTSALSDGQLLFAESFPRNIAVELAPGVEARFWWMIVL